MNDKGRNGRRGFCLEAASSLSPMVGAWLSARSAHHSSSVIGLSMSRKGASLQKCGVAVCQRSAQVCSVSHGSNNAHWMAHQRHNGTPSTLSASVWWLLTAGRLTAYYCHPGGHVQADLSSCHQLSVEDRAPGRHSCAAGLTPWCGVTCASCCCHLGRNPILNFICTTT